MADDKKIIFSMVGVSKVYPPQKKVLNNIYLSFFYGAKIGVIGLNGSGKSTLLKIIAGIEKNYQGEVHFSPGYSIGYLEQEPHLDETRTVRQIVEGVFRSRRCTQGLRSYQRSLVTPMYLRIDKMQALMDEQAVLQEKIDQYDAWNLDSRLEKSYGCIALSSGRSTCKRTIRR